jgi:hypothetical protein
MQQDEDHMIQEFLMMPLKASCVTEWCNDCTFRCIPCVVGDGRMNNVDVKTNIHDFIGWFVERDVSTHIIIKFDSIYTTCRIINRCYYFYFRMVYSL